MPASEIDDIFSKKPGKSQIKNATASSSSAVPSQAVKPPSDKKQKRKKKKKNTEDTKPHTDPQPTGSKRPPPETILDSSTLAQPVKRQKTTVVQSRPKTSQAKDPSENERFQDSRGSGPRRKTDEGWSIYKEAELSIDPEAGDTPLCPFDCDCCF